MPDLPHFKHIFPQFPQGAFLIHIKTGFAPKKQVVKYQRDVREVALALELNPDHLRKWIRLYKQELQGIEPAGNAITPEQREIQQLKAINALKRRESAQVLYTFIESLPRDPAPISLARLRARLNLKSPVFSQNQTVRRAMEQLREIGYLDYTEILRGRTKFFCIHYRPPG